SHNALFKSTDNGETWKFQNNYNSHSGTLFSGYIEVCELIGEDRLFVQENDLSIYKVETGNYNTEFRSSERYSIWCW
ncbi:hypothetical protein ACFLTE_12330, partial [Bacteroidota bacterium]